ncbi:MAG TPA: tRNA epoxyqueuosine(34) reductase QueG [Hellea balneolensis]|uniref:tRNA epoxyqueuosine(34) reductase QueG n=1 Tax=Hellea balneolensis TaxID=287478 RepID=A0A7C3C4Q0_9PROT|nr:tRNA epoxyqueuosine(34) reductase QueG [Hellea balneolensis]
MSELSKTVKKRIISLGFSTYGIVDVRQIGTDTEAGLRDFVAKNYHGDMAWMVETIDRRSHPLHLWPQAKSALVLGFNYGPDTDPRAILKQTDKGAISVYARGHDYHALIKGKLKELAGLIARDTGEDVKVFVDTAPLMEKPLAQLARVGWQGKHTNLVSKEFGSWLFLGVILSAAELDAHAPELDTCGTCSACLDICPTQAFPRPYQIDARKCISYLTIEYKGAVEETLRRQLGNRIYGCDDCLAVCPWNKFACTAHEVKFHARKALIAPDLALLAGLDDAAFRALFTRSPIKRIGAAQFLRNVLYAIGNSADPRLIEVAQNHLNHENNVVRDAAQWAVKRLGSI